MSEECARGCGERGSLFHILWACPKIQTYWEGLSRVKAEVVGEPVLTEPRWHILGVTGEITWPQWAKTWLALAGGVAKRNIARAWGAGDAPSVESWKRDMDWCHSAEQSVYQRWGCPRKWEKIWGAWAKYRGHWAED